MLRRTGEFWWKTTSGLLALAGVVLSVISLFGTGDWPQTSLAIGLALVALTSVVALIVAVESASAREQSDARALRWSLATRNIADAAQHLADIAAQSPHDEGQPPQARARDACAQIEKAFTSVAGSDCRVTIKELYADGGELAVRSLIVPSRRAVGHPTVDLIADNTDFARIMSGDDLFSDNDLPAAVLTGYRNSHWTPEALAEWNATGQYPYRSALVLPIRTRAEAGNAAMENWSTVGFLCVDSPKAHAFSIDEDRHPAELLASMFVAVWKDITEEDTR